MRFLSAACGAKRIETNKAVLAGRKQASVEEVASFLDQTEQASQAILNRLVAQGVLSEAREKGQKLYHVHFAAKRRRQAIWQALDDPGEMAARKHDRVKIGG